MATQADSSLEEHMVAEERSLNRCLQITFSSLDQDIAQEENYVFNAVTKAVEDAASWGDIPCGWEKHIVQVLDSEETDVNKDMQSLNSGIKGYQELFALRPRETKRYSRALSSFAAARTLSTNVRKAAKNSDSKALQSIHETMQSARARKPYMTVEGAFSSRVIRIKIIDERCSDELKRSQLKEADTALTMASVIIQKAVTRSLTDGAPISLPEGADMALAAAFPIVWAYKEGYAQAYEEFDPVKFQSSWESIKEASDDLDSVLKTYHLIKRPESGEAGQTAEGSEALSQAVEAMRARFQKRWDAPDS